MPLLTTKRCINPKFRIFTIKQADIKKSLVEQAIKMKNLKTLIKSNRIKKS